MPGEWCEECLENGVNDARRMAAFATFKLKPHNNNLQHNDVTSLLGFHPFVQFLTILKL